ncbi:cyclic-di-AMP-binding protein CbpB [Pseudoneobacillus rhizosphaerae]|jgi:predicted transcriptional regulator|uniref:CBS domain-containing protein YkuL n=1 Tax=Pseudoneobacillus rhizosphaerae TaxID=2880968 RepID=A0A9C7GAF9_9BACI|nr:cyclic-di-AMP-binding protein CbpB [Pseudoneobacillus rhizosphaerae]CAG9608620.1 CBS domain-containing protein YkuL [Pseudoneobacillus rhizosphaerae]
MINLHSGEFIDINIQDLMIPSERVAHVQVGNTLEHALLVLTKSGYTAIPVLDLEYKLKGLISTPVVLDSILGLERIEFEKLEKNRVEDVMNHSIPRISLTDSLLKGLGLLVDHPFICVENKDGYFEGILTRRAILKLLIPKN